MAAVDRRPGIAIDPDFIAEAAHVMDGVVDGDTDRDRGDRDGHQVQRYPEPAHQPEHEDTRSDIGDDRDPRHPQRAEQDHEHQHDGQEYRAQGQDLGTEQAVQHVVIQDQHAGQPDLLRFQPQLAGEMRANRVQQLLSSQVRVRFEYPDGEAQLAAVAGEIRLDQISLDVLRQALVDDGQQEVIFEQGCVELLQQSRGRDQRDDLAGLSQGIEIVVDAGDLA